MWTLLISQSPVNKVSILRGGLLIELNWQMTKCSPAGTSPSYFDGRSGQIWKTTAEPQQDIHPECVNSLWPFF
jgi:hypothetical protein